MTLTLDRVTIYLERYLNRIAVRYYKRGDIHGMSETLKAISDPVRRNILELLKEEKKSAGELASEFNLSGATVSYHLTQLKKAGLILETRHKNFIYYELNASVFEEVLVWIYGLGGKDNESR